MKQTARSLFKSKFISLFSFFLGIPLPYFGKVFGVATSEGKKRI